MNVQPGMCVCVCVCVRARVYIYVPPSSPSLPPPSFLAKLKESDLAFHCFLTVIVDAGLVQLIVLQMHYLHIFH